ncbi:MAG: hypothetical protein KGL39_32735 [Patescibacteria group bacterium]|nr:hypothetical protein [Patescibacteria group bacterium]
MQNWTVEQDGTQWKVVNQRIRGDYYGRYATREQAEQTARELNQADVGT